jgi:hypothetical protein
MAELLNINLNIIIIMSVFVAISIEAAELFPHQTAFSGNDQGQEENEIQNIK